jgi:hypothetical protein
MSRVAYIKLFSKDICDRLANKKLGRQLCGWRGDWDCPQQGEKDPPLCWHGQKLKITSRFLFLNLERRATVPVGTEHAKCSFPAASPDPPTHG